MNGDNRQQAFGQGNGNGTFVTPPDSPGFYYNNNPLMSQNRVMQEQQQQQQQSSLQQQPQQQEQQQQQQQQPLHQQIPQLPSSSLLRFGSHGPGQMHPGISSPALARAISTLSADKTRRPRSEKKPIPDEQKDDKYFERRRRNNEAAKKSRDARKAREDELAIRASYLEKDNSVLKVQVMSMREEAIKLRQMWFQKCQAGTIPVVQRHPMQPQAQARTS